MAAASKFHLERVAAYLKERRDEDASLADVIALAEITAQSLQTIFATIDSSAQRELREIADYIATMKVEIGALQFNELKYMRIPAAGQELDAIVKATEAASNTIMECAEAILAADPSDPDAFKAMVDEKMLIVFEACSFQDITGQRIAKVVETLQHIDSRVSRFAAVMETRDLDGYMTERERARASRKEKLLLNGPQLDGEGIAQTEVDQLFK